jgi:putative membrane protein
MKKKLNLNELIWLFILIGFSFYFYNLVYSRKLEYFIHPKMFKYIYFAIAALAFMSVYQIRNLFKSTYRGKLKFGYILFLFILFIGFVVNPKGLNTQAAFNRGVKIGDSTLNIKKEVDGKSNRDVTTSIDSKEIIEVNDENYISVLNEINTNIGAFKGKTIIVTGFIYKDDSFGKARYIAARMMINCCAADVEVVGYLLNYNGKDILLKEQWVKITGIISEDEIEDKSGIKKRVPVINVNKLERIKEPANKYVYE